MTERSPSTPARQRGRLGMPPWVSLIVAVAVGVAIVLSATVLVVTLAGLSAPADVFTGEVGIPAGEFFAFSLNVSRNHTEIFYDVRVVSGPAIDIFFLTVEDFDRYRLGIPTQDPESYGHGSTLRMPRTPYMNAGQYWFVLDNTDYGNMSPGGQTCLAGYDVRV